MRQSPANNIIALCSCLSACLSLPLHAADVTTDAALTSPAETAVTSTETRAETQPEPAPEMSPEMSQLAVLQAPPSPPQPPAAYDLIQESSTSAESSNDEEAETEITAPAIDTPMPPLIDQPVKPSYSLEQQEQEQPATQQDAGDTFSDDDSGSDPDAPAAEKGSETTKWTDTRPVKVSADWLQLTTGEWLRGRIIVMQKEDLEFDSDELKNLVFEWKKVRYLKSYEPYTLRFDGRRVVIGIIEVSQDRIKVSTDYDDQVFDRAELVSIASGKEDERSYWTNKISLSANIRRGNTNQADFTSKISAKRRTVVSRLLIDYLGNFTEIENTRTINNHRLNGNYDIFVSRSLFVTPIIAEYYRDPFQNIEQRLNVGVSIGYTIINTYRTEWDVSGGPAYQESIFVSVQAGDSDKDEAITINLNTKFDTELNSKVDLEGSYSVSLGDDKTGNYNHHSILTIETELTDKLDFDVSMVWDRVRSPVPDADQNVPEKDDFRIMIGLGYNL